MFAFMDRFTAVIDGKRFSWNVPPGHSVEASKMYFFWTSMSEKHELKLDEEWSKHKENSKNYNKTRYSYVEQFLCVCEIQFMFRRLKRINLRTIMDVKFEGEDEKTSNNETKQKRKKRKKKYSSEKRERKRRKTHRGWNYSLKKTLKKRKKKSSQSIDEHYSGESTSEDEKIEKTTKNPTEENLIQMTQTEKKGLIRNVLGKYREKVDCWLLKWATHLYVVCCFLFMSFFIL